MLRKTKLDLLAAPPTLDDPWESVRGDWLAIQKVNTRAAYQTAYRQFFAWCLLPPEAVTATDAKAYADYLHGQTLAGGTVNVKLAAMQSFYEHCRRSGHWAEQKLNPFSPFNAPRAEVPARRDLPGEIVAAIFDEINLKSRQGIRDFALLYTLAATNLAAREILQLRWGEVRRLPDTCVNVIAHYLQAADRLESIRRETFVFLPLQPTVACRLPHINGHVSIPIPISPDQANKILKKYARRVGYQSEVWLTMLRRCKLPAKLSELS